MDRKLEFLLHTLLVLLIVLEMLTTLLIPTLG